MDENREHVAKSCENCQVNWNMPSKALMYPWENSKSLWVRIHLDYTGPYLEKNDSSPGGFIFKMS